MADGECACCGAAYKQGRPECAECGSPTRMQPCKICRKPMPAGAAKCTECDCYQAWWRLDLSSAFIAAVSALITTVVALWSLMQSTLAPQFSDTRLIGLQDESAASFDVLARNDGSLSSFVIEGSLTCTSPEGFSLIGPLLVTRPEDLEIEPGRITVLTLLPAKRWDQVVRKGSQEKSLTIGEVEGELSVTGFANESDCRLRLEIYEYSDGARKLVEDEASYPCGRRLSTLVETALKGSDPGGGE